MSEKQIAQEYLCDFAASGETFLGAADIKWVGDCIMQPIARENNDKNIRQLSFLYEPH